MVGSVNLILYGSLKCLVFVDEFSEKFYLLGIFFVGFLQSCLIYGYVPANIFKLEFNL